MAGRSVSIREILYGVRLNFSLVVILLVTLSVLLLGLVLLADISERNEYTSENLSLIAPNDPGLQDYLAQNQDPEVVRLANLIWLDFQQDTRTSLLVVTPLIIALAGISAFITARYLVRPIKETYNAQERFLQDAAHELRNPLGAMKVTIQNMQAKDTLTSADAEKLIATTDRQVDRLIKINENLLYLDRAVQKPEDDKVNISELLMDVVEDQQALAHSKNLVIHSKIDADVFFSIASEDFVRLCRNIIENAVKYSTESSREIRISLSKKNGKIRFSVRDFGVGIPSRELHNIGSRFYRASNTSLFEGTGLGMAIVQKIVSTYGGLITVNSRESEGTHVVINL